MSHPAHALEQLATPTASLVRRRVSARAQRLLAAVAAALAVAGASASLAPAAHADTYYKLVAHNSALTLDVQGGSTSPGAPVIQWYDNGGANQRWTLPISRATEDWYGTGAIRNQNSGQCLTTDFRAGDQLYQYPCLTSGGYPVPTQNWIAKRVNADGVSEYSTQLLNPASGLVVDVGGYSLSPGAAIIGWPAANGSYAANQVFEQYA